MARFLEIIPDRPLPGGEIIYAFLDEVYPIKLRRACEKLTKFTLTHIQQKEIPGSSCPVQVYRPNAPEDQRQVFLASLGVQDQNTLKRAYLNHLKDTHPPRTTLCDSLLLEDETTWKPSLMSDIFRLELQVIGLRTDDGSFEYRF